MTNEEIKQNGTVEQYVFLEGEKNIFIYQKIKDIGSGCSGAVYKVSVTGIPALKEGALKICTTKLVDDFRSNARGLYQEKNYLNHFVKTLKVGTVVTEKDVAEIVSQNGLNNLEDILKLQNDQIASSIRNAIAKKGVPAMLMEYGGTDLRSVYDYLQENSEAVSKTVVEAFKYKVLKTVAEGLASPEENSIYHGDLIPSNILCGFDLNDVKDDVSALKKALLKGRITLCDRLVNEKVGTKSLGGPSYTQGVPPNSLFFDAYCPPLSSVGNSWSFLALWSWLFSENGRKILPVDAFANEKKFKFEFDKEKYERNLNSVAEFKNLLEQEVDSSGYFFRRSMIIDDNNYPVVYRPIDIFDELSIGNVFLDKNSLINYYTKSEHAYLKLKGRGGKKQTTDEKKQMIYRFSETVLRSVKKMDEEIGKLIIEKKPLLTKEGNLRTELSTLERKIVEEVKKKENAIDNIKKLAKKIGENPEDYESASYMLNEQNNLCEAKKAYGQYQTEIPEKKSDIDLCKKNQEKFDESEYLKALHYVKEELIKEVEEDTVKNSIMEVLKKRGIS